MRLPAFNSYSSCGAGRAALCETLEQRRLLAAAYHLTFDDEFNSLHLSTYNSSGNLINTAPANSGWLTNDAYHAAGYSGTAGTELEYYANPATDAYDPFSTSNGILSITAQPTPASMVGIGTGKTQAPYVSGMLSSAQGQSYTKFNQSDGFSQEYGYFEIRCEVPQGAGMWPAFWLLPEPNLDTTDAQAEYDICEIPVNPNGDEPQNTQTIYQVAHSAGAPQVQNSYTLPAGEDASTAFHTYGFEWDANSVRWYVDGQLTAVTSNVCNTPMYMLANLAIGSDWPGSPTSSAEFPATMKIDYIRVYSANPSIPVATPQPGYSVDPFTLDAISVGTQPPTVPGAPLLLNAPSSTAVTISWAPSTDNVGIQDYIIFRNGQQITTTTAATYSDSGITPATAFSYTIEAVDNSENVSGVSGALSVTTLAAGSSRVTGIASANTTASYNNSGNIYLNAVDGNTSTFFDSPIANGNWVQLDLGSSKTITDIAYAPRPGFEIRMAGGIFEASTDPTFSTGVITLDKIFAQPSDGLTVVPITPAETFRYVRYVAPAGSFGDIAEMQVFGTSSSPSTAPPGTPTLISSTPTSATIAWAASATAGISGYTVFRNGAQIGTTNATTLNYSDHSLTASTRYIYTVDAVAAGVASAPSGALSITTPAATAIMQLTGTASANTTGSYNNYGDTYSSAFDGNVNTFFDSPIANGNYVQLNLGSQATITQIAFAPRVGYEYRMQGGVFEASNDPTFTTGVATLYTVNSTPPDGLNTIAVSGTYQFIRYVAPANSYGNIAEMQVFGLPATTAPTPSPLSGTASANTTASYDNDGDTYTNVFDGNTSTFFDAPTGNGDYVQLDLGAAHTISSISYAPRVGFEYRMVGGYFEASNDSTFSTGVTTLYTITSTPPDGLTNVSVNAPGTFRYIRYVSPASSYGNIAEMKVFGY